MSIRVLALLETIASNKPSLSLNLVYIELVLTLQHLAIFLILTFKKPSFKNSSLAEIKSSSVAPTDSIQIIPP